ncbi:hypothetical protein HV110_28450 (plasmid) [Klebsiella oxytoca]|uniref:hypothetical protein n=1 Tax=Klebsiella TaxID=570 RepID=UPI0007DAD043|nr:MULTISPECIES: hypothetical protein [Klebsiella]MBA8015911.1 hypothetical protein [Klebsiella oxytoca]MBZ7570148.1 hypothetical protein [Klebsiella grimontii]MDG9901553.1 hypothetical protein [Klebsiella grimontii]MDU7373603.1 hypothetical protein [Klebsiella michiganensis]
MVLTFNVPDPAPAARTKKREKIKKRKKEYAKNVHSRDPRRAWRSGAKALQGYRHVVLRFECDGYEPTSFHELSRRVDCYKVHTSTAASAGDDE